MSFESRIRAIVLEECGSRSTQAYSIERGEVLMHRLEYGEGCPPDNRGIESAPYARHASPMARYKPMLRLLDDEDLEILRLPKLEYAAKRVERRKIYEGYLADLKREVEGILKAHAESGSMSIEGLYEETKCSRSCIAQLERHAWKHWCGLGGVPEMVAATMKDLTAALRFGELIQLPANAQAIA